MFVATSPSSRAPRSQWAVAADVFDPRADKYAADPVGFASDVLGFEAWSKQADILQSVRDHDRTAVRACHGPGKTAVGAVAALWFLGTHPNSRVITTAPTWAQVEQLLWREIRGAVARAHRDGKGEQFPVPSATKLDISEQWFAIGLSTNEPERFQGHHADHLLLIADEASGVDEDIYEASEGFMTAEGAKVLLLGNPTKLGGQFHRAFTQEAARWSKVHISVYDTPAFTGEQVPSNVLRSLPTKKWVQDALDTYGKASPMFQVRALGEFPSHASNAVIALHLVVDAQARDIPVRHAVQQDDVTVAIDVARFGSDETVIATRHTERVRLRQHYVGKATTETVGRAIAVWRELRAEAGADPRFVVDDDGVGGGVTDQLREKGYEVTAFNGGARAIEATNYPNRRSELWFTMGRHLGDLDLDPDDQLAADLTSPTYKFDSDGRRVVERKDETKKRLGRSPDRGDAALLTLVRPRAITLPDPEDRATPTSRPDWMPEWEGDAPLGGSLTADLLNEEM